MESSNLSFRQAMRKMNGLLPTAQHRLHKLWFLQKLSCQKPCWDQDRLSSLVYKLHGVGSFNNRPSTDLLNQFVKKKKKKKRHLTHATWHVTCDILNLTPYTWYVTHDMWHMTCDTWHVTHDMWHMVGGEHSHKMSAPELLQFGIDSVLKILNKSMNDLSN